MTSLERAHRRQQSFGTVARTPDRGIGSEVAVPSRYSSRLRRLIDSSLVTARFRWWEMVACASILSLVGALVFGSHVVHGGFYNDDWSFASTYRFRPEPGLFGAIEAFDWLSFRPMATVYWPFMHAVFGLDASGHLAWVVFTAIAMSAALFLLLRTLDLERVHAVTVAVLVLVFPASDANRLFTATSIALPGITLYLLGTVLALHGLQTRGSRGLFWHIGAISFYVLSVMFYEIAAGAILLSILLYLLRASWRDAVWRWVTDVVVVGVVLATVTSGSWNEPQSSETIVRHARVMARQAAILFTEVVVPFGSLDSSLVAGVLGALFLTAAYVWWRVPVDDAVHRALGRWLLTTIVGAVTVPVGYAIFVTADLSYLPLRPGQSNRVNGLAAVGFVLTLYALAMVAGTLIARRSKRWREWSTLFALALCLVVGAGWVREISEHKAQWARATDAQADILDSIAQAVPKLPPGTTAYAVGASTQAAPGVPTFAATWDLSGALQIERDDPSLRAYPAIPGTQFVCGRHTISADNGNDVFETQDARYGAAVVVDIPTSSAYWITNRSSCMRASARFSS
jgi:hypothetical protein